jgi:hypothetical protein
LDNFKLCFLQFNYSDHLFIQPKDSFNNKNYSKLVTSGNNKLMDLFHWNVSDLDLNSTVSDYFYMFLNSTLESNSLKNNLLEALKLLKQFNF